MDARAQGNVPERQGALQQGFQVAVDLGLLAILFVAPLFMGGRGPVGKFVLLALVAVTTGIWLVRQCFASRATWQWSGVEWLLLTGAGLIVLQLVPLPTAVLAWLSPSLSDLLPLWMGASTSPFPAQSWTTISLHPDATRGGLAMFVAYATLFLLVVQRLREATDVRRLLSWIAVATVAMAVLGMAQFLVGNGKFLWVFEHPSRSTLGAVKGTFHNQNHFAHFLALGIGPLIWAVGAWHRAKLGQALLLVGAGVVSLAALLTFSRGGVIAFTLAASLSLGFYYLQGILDRKALWLVGAASLLLALTLGIHGYEPLARKLATLRDSSSLEELSTGREALWGALLEAIPHFARAGSGIGTHRDLYPIFMERYFPFEFSHGENGYLPLLLESGVPGLVLFLIGVGYCGFWSTTILLSRRRLDAVRGGKRRPGTGASLAARSGWSAHGGSWDHDVVSAAQPSPSLTFAGFWGAVVPGLVASLVHSLSDFVWYVSSCMALTVVLIAALCRTHQLAKQAVVEEGTSDEAESRVVSATSSHGRRSDLPRFWWLTVTAIVWLLATCLLIDRQRSAWAAPHYYAYLRLSLPAAQIGTGNEADEQERLERLALHLRAAADHDPADARINLKLAAVHLRLFDLLQRRALNPLPLSQIRDAAIASQFASREALQAWLERAIGPNAQHLQDALQLSHRSLRACPLQGEGYVYLAELTFLEGWSGDAKRDYLAQAEKVRPYSGMVLFAKGQEAALEDNLPVAVAAWQQAFATDPEVRELIVDTFAGRVPARFFLDQFPLDLVSCERLFRIYEPIQPTEARQVAEHYVQLAEGLPAEGSAETRARRWLTVHRFQNYLGQPAAALHAAMQAVDEHPQGIVERKTLARELMVAQRFDEAAEHLAWCVRRAPHDVSLNQLLTECQRRIFQHQADASAAPHATPRRS